jgi:hypothetical protein
LPFLDKMVVDEHVGKVDAAERSLAASRLPRWGGGVFDDLARDAAPGLVRGGARWLPVAGAVMDFGLNMAEGDTWQEASAS